MLSLQSVKSWPIFHIKRVTLGPKAYGGQSLLCLSHLCVHGQYQSNHLPQRWKVKIPLQTCNATKPAISKNCFMDYKQYPGSIYAAPRLDKYFPFSKAQEDLEMPWSELPPATIEGDISSWVTASTPQPRLEPQLSSVEPSQ